jgi:hypothetical protein
MPAAENPRKLVIKDGTGRKITVQEIPATSKHVTINLIPQGMIEVYEKNVLIHQAAVGKEPKDVDFTPPPPPPAPSYMPEKIEPPSRGSVARVLGK